jgi:hypothetical protein
MYPQDLHGALVQGDLLAGRGAVAFDSVEVDVT